MEERLAGRMSTIGIQTMTFQLDTSGAVIGAVSWNSQEGQLARHREIMHRRPHGETIWSDLSPFTQGYIEALFASLPGLDQQGRMIPRHPDVAHGGVHVMGFSDLAPETLARIIADCASFENIAGGVGQKTGLTEGRRFWEGQQRGMSGALGAAFPPQTVQLGDDGKVKFA